MPLFAAIISGLCFTLLGILFKRLSTPQSSPLVLPSWLGLLFPVWAAAFVATSATGTLSFNLTPSALLWPFLWAACTVTTTTLLVWLVQALSLTELAGYKKAILTFMASGTDILLFQTKFPFATLTAIGLILAGSLILGYAKHKLPTGRQFAILVVWCALLTAQIAFYKQGQTHQPQVLSFTILAQGMSTLLYTFFWLSPSVKTTPFRLTPALPLLAVALTGTLIEGFAYAALPLAVIIIITMSGAALFAVHDLFHGDLPLTRRTTAALTAIAAGFLILFMK